MLSSYGSLLLMRYVPRYVPRYVLSYCYCDLSGAAEPIMGKEQLEL